MAQLQVPQPIRHTTRNVLIAVAAGIVGLAIVIGVIVAVTPRHPTGGSPAGVTTPATPAAARTTVAAPQPTYADPVAADFTLTPKITKKDCFGSAGCNVVFSVDLTYTGAGAKPNSSWDITYDVVGADDTTTDTLTINFDGTGRHGSYTARDDQYVSTKSSKVTLSLAITRISPSS